MPTRRTARIRPPRPCKGRTGWEPGSPVRPFQGRIAVGRWFRGLHPRLFPFNPSGIAGPNLVLPASFALPLTEPRKPATNPMKSPQPAGRLLAALLTTIILLRADGRAGSWPDLLVKLERCDRSGSPPATDWLIDPTPFTARVFRGTGSNELVLANGLIARTFRLAPNAATVGLDNLVTGEAMLRGVKPEAIVEIDGTRYEVGGLKGQPNYAFLRPEWVEQLRADPAAFRFVGLRGRQAAGAVRLETGPPSRAGSQVAARGRLAAAGFRRADRGIERDGGRTVERRARLGPLRAVRRPALLQQVDHGRQRHGQADPRGPVLQRSAGGGGATSEVDELTAGRTPPNLHVETDMAFGGMMAAGANRRSFRWLPDPEFHTQVNYEKKTPCLLDIGPDLGPAQEIAPGGTFESFRAWVLPFDSTDRERCGLADAADVSRSSRRGPRRTR